MLRVEEPIAAHSPCPAGFVRFRLGEVQPGAVLLGVMPLEAFDEMARLARREGSAGNDTWYVLILSIGG